MIEDEIRRLWELVQAWVSWHFGLPGWIVLICLAGFCVVLLFVWKDWDKFSKAPGVPKLLKLTSRLPLPTADPSQLSVMIAKLNRDSDDTFGNQIFELLREFPGVQALPLDRTLGSEGRIDDKIEAKAAEAAHKYLKDSVAAVLIWGSVLDSERKIAKLYLTTSSVEPGDGMRGKQYGQETGSTLRLPDIFWADLAHVLRLAIASRHADLRAKQGTYIADRLPPFIAGVQRLLMGSQNRPGWNADARGSTLLVLADALLTLGEQSGKNEPLQEAIEAYREALQLLDRDRVPLYWAVTQNNLGSALSSLGEWESGTKRLDEAVQAYSAALEEFTRDRVPLQWAITQNNLGLALATLGERERGTRQLQKAVEAYRGAFEELRRDGAPLLWATIQNNLGNALSAIGERESGIGRLKEAVGAYRAALEERTRKRVPLDWATTQNNLGTALAAMGWRESGTRRLQQAINAYNAALKERTRERVPLLWATTKYNLGRVLYTTGQREAGTKHLQAAVDALREALEEWKRDRAPLDWAKAQTELGLALAMLGERTRDRTKIEEAQAAFKVAFDLYIQAGQEYRRPSLEAVLRTIDDRLAAMR